MSQPNGNGVMTATEPVVRALLDEAIAKRYTGGVLGVRAAARWEGSARFIHDGKPVVVAPCESTLAVWEALRERSPQGWLVVLTPRDSDDLGAGALSHFIWNWLRTPDPWQAVQQRFQAESLEPALYTHPDHRAVATGLLAAMPDDGWPPAPGGVLTRDHAIDAVVRAHLRLVERGVEIDVRATFEWSIQPDSTALLAELRTLVGDTLTNVVIEWLAGRCGLAERPVGALLRAGRVADLVPLGLIAGLISGDDTQVVHAAGVVQGRYGFGQLTREVLNAWHADAAGLTTQVLEPDLARRAVDTATSRLDELDLRFLAEHSDLLPAGLQVRLKALAQAIRAALPLGEPSQVDAPLVTADLSRIEDTWDAVREHHLAKFDPTVAAFGAARRLLRWLAGDTTSDMTLTALMRRQVDTDAWVDSAVNDSVRGSSDSALAEVLGAVLDLVRRRRDEHDIAFAAALAEAPEPAELCVEGILPDHVIPLACQHPVLLLVIDALSVGVATELMTDAVAAGWVEYALPGRRMRSGALAVLPTVTKYSRCSLLSGDLVQGTAPDERRGFAQLLKQSHLGGPTDTPIFHQKDLDIVRPGLALAPAAQNAIADTEQRRLVAAVLNTVDDTLHHTDPVGADWTLTTITHLRPLLEAARQAGRTVVITSDHGHVIERRNGEFRSHGTVNRNRARPVTPEVAPDEVLVRGPRVLVEGGAAVLAVNERIRYGPINRGYHGGASPAEVVVPVFVLHAGDPPAGLTPVEGVRPQWWDQAASPASATMETAPPESDRNEGLFELTESASVTAAAVDRHALATAKAVIGSKVFKQQKAIAGRVPVPDDRIRALLTSLLSAPGTRVPGQQAADDLGIAAARLRGALPLLKRVLDVEGYVVLRYEAESGDVVLDEAMLREQFRLER